jgi:arylsulfatase A-like enzyme
MPMSDAAPNITLVSIDSLRGDHCGYLGDDRGLTPELDELAAEGVAFENAIATGPQTFSSMPSVFTGQPRPPTSLENHPQESHWERRLAAIDGHLSRYASLAERLQDRGYETAGVTPNPWASMASGFDRGFERFVDFSDSGSEGWVSELADRVPGVDTTSRPVELLLNMLAGSEFFARWEDLYDEILRIREGLSEPYFLWVFILDTHFPFITSRAHREEQSLFETYACAYRSSEAMRGNRAGMAESVRESVTRSYRDTIRASDAFLGQLRSDLAADDPVFMVHSDHGESFGEHGNYGHHHRQVYEENVHVPYVVHNAGVSANVRAPTSLASVYDTALAVAREGTFDPSGATDPYVIASSECGTNRAVRGPQFKYIEQGDEHLLFDLDADPDEVMDLSKQCPDLCRKFRRRLTRLDSHTSETEQLHRATKTLASHGGI